jgi:uncharacterized protein YjiS (DUF1127 family)
MSPTANYEFRRTAKQSRDVADTFNPFVRILRTVRVWRDARQLSQFNDDLLNDIFLTRSEIKNGLRRNRF